MDGASANVALAAAVERRRESAGERILPVSQIKPWPDQPRKFFSKESIHNLAASINEVGQKVPILVQADPSDPNCFLIIDGERRWRASKLLNRKTMRAIVCPATSDEERYIQSVVSNFGRERHTPYETALALRRIHSTGKYSIPQIAAMFAKSDPWVYQHLSLTKLDPKVVAMMDFVIPAESRLKFCIALPLTVLPKDLQVEIAQEIVAKKMKAIEARHHVLKKAAERGFAVGSAARPNRRRASLDALVANTDVALTSFLQMPETPLGDFLESFSKQNLAKILALADNCCDGFESLRKAIQEALRGK